MNLQFPEVIGCLVVTTDDDRQHWCNLFTGIVPREYDALSLRSAKAADEKLKTDL